MKMSSFVFFFWILLFLSLPPSLLTSKPPSLDNYFIHRAVTEYFLYGNDNPYGPIESWNTSSITSMEWLFWDYFGKESFNIDISKWNVRNVATMRRMFYKATVFNGDLSLWDVSNVSDMEEMFSGSSSFSTDIRNWDVSNVMNMRRMFHKAISFTSDIQFWNVSNVLDMVGMFSKAKSFNTDISNWNISNVTDMTTMFADATSFNIDLSPWDISRVTDMYELFQYTPSLKQVLCWDLSYVHNDKNMIKNSAATVEIYPNCVKHKQCTTLRKIFHTIPLYILSGLSAKNELLCLNPANNYIAEGTSLEVSTCREWKSYQWTTDYDGKLRNVHDPSLCVHKRGNQIILSTCINKSPNQQWRYSRDKRLVSYSGRMGIVVESSKLTDKSLVKNFVRQSDVPLSSERWEFQLVTKATKIYIPSISIPFYIVSGITNSVKKWCLYPEKNTMMHGTTLVLASCKDWKTFQWSLDTQGKLHNVHDLTKCITLSGKKLKINPCRNNHILQRWAYDYITTTLSTLVNGHTLVIAEYEKTKDNSDREKEKIQIKSIITGQNIPKNFCQVSWELENI